MSRAVVMWRLFPRAAGLVVVLAILAGCPGPGPVNGTASPKIIPVEALSAQLTDQDWKRRVDAARKLGASRHVDAVVSLSGAVGDSDQRVRLAVVDACGVHGSPKLVAALMKALSDEVKQVRRRAVRALAKIGTREAAEAMIGSLDGASMWLRPAVADGLCALPPKALVGLEVAIQILVAELEVSQKKRFGRLSKALLSIGDPALKAMLRAINNPAGPDSEKRLPVDMKCERAPCRVLVGMGVRGIPKLMTLVKNGVEGVARWTLNNMILPAVFSKVGASALPHMVQLFGDYGRHGKLAEKTLDMMGDAATPALLKLLRKPGMSVKHRVTLIELLGENRGVRVQRELLRLLKTASAAEQAAAVFALAKAPTAKTMTALAKVIKSGTPALRRALVKGAAEGKGKLVTKLLILALRGKDQALRLAAVSGLGRLGNKRAKEVLKRLVGNRNKTIAAAAKAALTPRTALKSVFPRVGVPECDRYLAAMSCYLGKMPAAAAAVVRPAMIKTVQAFQKMAAGPARSSLAKTCRMAFAAWSKTISKTPRYRSCFVP